MSGRRGILGLPDAVLRQICTQFCPHCGGEDCLGGCELPDSFWGPEYFGTLAALAQVNVRLGRQAQAVRLHVFCGRRDSLPLLARTLAEHPGLAAHICVVRLGDRDRDAGHGGILGELATPGNIDSLAALVAPSVGNNALFTGASGDQQLLAPFMQLPAIEETFLCAPGGEEMPADTPEAMNHIANARLNAFIVFSLAKNIKSLAILGEWPLALFPDSTQGQKTIDIGPLPAVESLRLGSSSHHSNNSSSSNSGSQIRGIDMRKIASLLARLPNLGSLELRGGHDTLSAAQLRACSPMANLTAIKLTATSLSAVDDILLACRSGPLKHFHFSIPGGIEAACSHGNDIQGRELIDRLIEYGLEASIESLHIDTSASILFAADPWDIQLRFQTVRTLRDFHALRHLSISADSIYYPSGYPRVLLRDPNTGDERSGGRLCALLPAYIESLEITGIYAIRTKDVLELARAAFPRVRFDDLKTVRLRGDMSDAIVPIADIPYPVYYDDESDEEASGEVASGDEAEDNSEDWDSISDSEGTGICHGPTASKEIARVFLAAGVDYEFDMPQYYFNKYLGDWDKDARD